MHLSNEEIYSLENWKIQVGILHSPLTTASVKHITLIFAVWYSSIARVLEQNNCPYP